MQHKTTCTICNCMSETTDRGQCQQCSSLLRWVASYYADLPNVALKIGPDLTFLELGVDSLDYIDWTLEAEKVFKVIIPDREAESIRTVGEFIRRLKTAGAS